MKASTKTFTVNSQSARDAIKKHLIRLQNANNGVQFEAQIHERDAVNVLVEMMHNEDLPAALRRQVALDITILARGTPKPWLHTGEDINPEAEGGSGLGATVGQELAAAKITADLHKELDRLTSMNVHPRDWPEEVRSVATDMVLYYEGEDATPAKG